MEVVQLIQQCTALYNRLVNVFPAAAAATTHHSFSSDYTTLCANKHKVVRKSWYGDDFITP